MAPHARRRSRNPIAAAAAALALASTACQATPPATPNDPPALLAASRDAGLALSDPFAIDDEVVHKVAQAVGERGTPAERLRRLRDYLRAYQRDVGFSYERATLTANEAYHAGKGDCMAFTLLFSALSHRLGLPTYVVHVTRMRTYYEASNTFFVSSHVAVAMDRGPNAVVVDFSEEIDDYRVSLYDAISDDAARALFYNNLAVDAMLAGRLSQAEDLLRFLLAQQPDLPELHNNLGVLLNRKGRAEEALLLLEGAIARFPTYLPLYTNALEAARRAHRPDREVSLEQRARALAESDPYFAFSRGLALFEDQRFADAAKEIQRAVDEEPSSVTMWSWLARAYLSAGDTANAKAALTRAKNVSPNDASLRALEASFTTP